MSARWTKCFLGCRKNSISINKKKHPLEKSPRGYFVWGQTVFDYFEFFVVEHLTHFPSEVFSLEAFDLEQHFSFDLESLDFCAFFFVSAITFTP